MKISYKLIQQYINLPLSPEELGEKLTMAGLEVGAIEKRGGDLTGCVAGQILEINPHPQADRLTVCRVNAGGAEVLTIVCGAQNMKEGDKVPVALINCKLPGGFTIKRSKLRGVVSEGMMCSEKELGLSDESSGLMILPQDAPIGVEIASYLGLDDTVLEVELTPNRGDCLSIRGIVREIGALTGEKPKKMSVAPAEEGEKIDDLLSLEILDLDLCPRYTARIISGVTIGPSPLWLVQTLKSLGLRSINNVVDVTNFVMMECGQPLHAFDYDLIQGRKIIVRRAAEGEKIVTLDKAERSLTPLNLVIADAERPVALAGVMGGANTEVCDQTSAVLLESALFDPAQIRRTASSFGLHSEASHRFERGIDPQSVVSALNRAAQLILEVAGGKVAKGVADIYPRPFEPRCILLRLSVLADVLGTEVAQERVLSILQDLDFLVTRTDENTLSVSVPPLRWDIEREIDLIEEIARIYGYSNIPLKFPAAALSPDQKTKPKDFETKIRNVLIGLGFCEAINFSFISGKMLDELPSIDPSSSSDSRPGGRVYLKNPLVEGHNVMRTSLIPGLLGNVAYNQNRQMENIRLFEIGKCFFPGNNGSLPNEKIMLALVMQGTREPRSFRGKPDPLTFFDVKGVVMALMVGLKVSDYVISPQDTPWLGSHQAACLKDPSQPIGFLGRVGQNILEYVGIEKEVFAVELQVELLKASEKMTLKVIPKYPSVSRDLALIVPDEVIYQEVEQSIWEMSVEILQEINLFDLYRGEQIPDGKKSLGLSLTYQSLTRTLTDQEVNTVHEKVIAHLSQRFCASLRE